MNGLPFLPGSSLFQQQQEQQQQQQNQQGFSLPPSLETIYADLMRGSNNNDNNAAAVVGRLVHLWQQRQQQEQTPSPSAPNLSSLQLLQLLQQPQPQPQPHGSTIDLSTLDRLKQLLATSPANTAQHLDGASSSLETLLQKVLTSENPAAVSQALLNAPSASSMAAAATAPVNALLLEQLLQQQLHSLSSNGGSALVPSLVSSSQTTNNVNAGTSINPEHILRQIAVAKAEAQARVILALQQQEQQESQSRLAAAAAAASSPSAILAALATLSNTQAATPSAAANLALSNPYLAAAPPAATASGAPPRSSATGQPNGVTRLAPGINRSSSRPVAIVKPKAKRKYKQTTTQASSSSSPSARPVVNIDSKAKESVSGSCNSDGSGAVDGSGGMAVQIKKRRRYSHESFPEKLHRILQETSRIGDTRERIISWTQDGSGFEIHNIKAFEAEIIPVYFRHRRLTSFRRQLSMYGFRRGISKQNTGCYAHELFHRDYPERCKEIKRLSEFELVANETDEKEQASISASSSRT